MGFSCEGSSFVHRTSSGRGCKLSAEIAAPWKQSTEIFKIVFMELMSNIPQVQILGIATTKLPSSSCCLVHTLFHGWRWGRLVGNTSFISAFAKKSGAKGIAATVSLWSAYCESWGQECELYPALQMYTMCETYTFAAGVIHSARQSLDIWSLILMADRSRGARLRYVRDRRCAKQKLSM